MKGITQSIGRSRSSARRNWPPGSRWSAGWRQHAINFLLLASRSNVPSRLRQFRGLESASPATVDEHQRLQLLELLRYCQAHVPYYRRLIDSCNLDISERFSVQELKKLPLLTKETIRQEGVNLHSDEWKSRGAFRNTSGGSTGKPVVLLQDRAYYEQSVVAAKLIYNEYLGKGPGELEINLWGSERDIHRGSLGMKKAAINFVYNRRFQNSFLVDDHKLGRFVDEINRCKPVSMWAYVDSIDLMAKFIRRHNLDVHSPRLIISTAGTLHPDIRQCVQEVFRCPVYNQYGSREVGTIAFEMHDQHGLRGLPYLNFIEIVEGNVVVTNLTNYSMPLLRYEIGDTAEPWFGAQDEQYGCRRKVMKTVTGRQSSHFRTANGELVHGGFFTHQFYFLNWVAQFQVIQESINQVTCRLVLAEEAVDADMEVIRSRIRGVMGSACCVDFEFTDRIAPSTSGKYMYTISKVSTNLP